MFYSLRWYTARVTLFHFTVSGTGVSPLSLVQYPILPFYDPRDSIIFSLLV